MRRWRSQQGAELIELALTLPLLLAVMLAIVDFGFLFQKYEIISNSAREGVRIAARAGYSDTEVTTRVTDYVAAGGLPNTPTVTITPTTVSAAGSTWPASSVTVTYDHEYVFLGPVAGFIGGSFTNVTLTAQATMRDEVAGGGSTTP